MKKKRVVLRTRNVNIVLIRQTLVQDGWMKTSLLSKSTLKSLQGPQWSNWPSPADQVSSYIHKQGQLYVQPGSVYTMATVWDIALSYRQIRSISAAC
jgi:hypothetical protein